MADDDERTRHDGEAIGRAPEDAGGRSPGQQRWWFCIRHMRVEPADTPCPGKDLLGPYPNRQEAERALEKVKERNAAWDAED